MAACDEALGQVWFAPSNPPITQDELVELIEAELSHPVRTLVGGPLVLQMLGLFNKELGETVEMLYEWTDPFVVNTSKAEQAFGWQATPLEAAVKETLTWCRENVESKK